MLVIIYAYNIYYFRLLGGVSIDDCQPCYAGYYCAVDGLSYPTGPCAAGYYCPDDANITQPFPSDYLCWTGKFCL